MPFPLYAVKLAYSFQAVLSAWLLFTLHVTGKQPSYVEYLAPPFIRIIASKSDPLACGSQFRLYGYGQCIDF